MREHSRRGFIQGTLGAAAYLALPGRLMAQAPGGAPPGQAPGAQPGASPSDALGKFPPIIPAFPHILHGGDWSPEQWLDEPGVIEEDFRLMEKAGCNTFSIGIFSWAHLEPEEGRFTLEWLDRIMDGLAKHGFYAFLATPSGAKPRWMSHKYPEVRRIGTDGQRELHGTRHNHCLTSPVYRDKVRTINSKLAERYRGHKALALWHISNEYNGACYCDLCLGAFRAWLKARYGTLEKLNKAWWTSFWSQTFQAWDQIDPRQAPVDGLLLDWDRFVTHQTVDFMRNEIEPLKRLSPDIPVTTNLMGLFPTLDNRRFADVCDRMSWDAYPMLHGESSWREVARLGFTHDLFRSMKRGLPFILMESTPSNTNWFHTPALKRPGQHRQEMLIAMGHGADTTMYFQWRKSRGSYEKFHGAVVDHKGNERTRVFEEVAAHGASLKAMDAVVGTTVRPEVALIFDWEVRWALVHARGPRGVQGGGTARFEKEYTETCIDHYRPFWKLGVPVDVVESAAPFDAYKLVVAPMLFLLKPGVVERLDAFVKGGGTLLLTYLSGIVNETGLVLTGGWPGGGLRRMAGIWAEEIDSLYPSSPQRIVALRENPAGLVGEHPVRDYCDRIHAEGAAVLATYKTDFYAGQPCLTVNRYGNGRVYYLAARPAADGFHDALAAAISRELKIERNLDVALPEGVTVQKRAGGGRTLLFLHNTKGVEQALELGPTRLKSLTDATVLTGRVTLAPYASHVVERP